MDRKAINEARQFVSCSFCNEQFPSSRDMGDHLMMCGNKTDQCPKCKQYVRRAIFAYHYENDCAADPDAPISPSNHASNRPDTSSTPYLDNSSRPRVTITCPFCGQNYDQTESRIHKENCLQKPANIAHKHRPLGNENFNQSSDRSGHIEEFPDIAYVPCEYCYQPIEWSRLTDHTNACRERENRRIQEQSRPTSRETVPSVIRCAFCKQLMSSDGIDYHQRCCKKNPHRNANYGT